MMDAYYGHVVTVRVHLVGEQGFQIRIGQLADDATGLIESVGR